MARGTVVQKILPGDSLKTGDLSLKERLWGYCRTTHRIESTMCAEPCKDKKWCNFHRSKDENVKTDNSIYTVADAKQNGLWRWCTNRNGEAPSILGGRCSPVFFFLGIISRDELYSSNLKTV